MIPWEIERYLKKSAVRVLLQKVGLWSFVQLPAITIDIKRIHEFVETIQPNGKCQVTNFEGQVKELTVTPRTVALA